MGRCAVWKVVGSESITSRRQLVERGAELGRRQQNAGKFGRQGGKVAEPVSQGKAVQPGKFGVLQMSVRVAITETTSGIARVQRYELQRNQITKVR